LVSLNSVVIKGGYNEGDYELEYNGKNAGKIYLKVRVDGLITSTSKTSTSNSQTYSVQFKQVEGSGNNLQGNQVNTNQFNNINFDNNNFNSQQVFNNNNNNIYSNNNFNNNVSGFQGGNVGGFQGGNVGGFQGGNVGGFQGGNVGFQDGNVGGFQGGNLGLSNNTNKDFNFILSNNINGYQDSSNNSGNYSYTYTNKDNDYQLGNNIYGGSGLNVRETIWYKTLTYPKNCLFFRNNTGNLFYFNFQTQNWTQINLQGHVFFPKFTRATELPDGSFLLTGGEYNGATVNNTFHFLNGLFKDKASMLVSRKAHSAIYLKGFVYVFGGFTDNGIINDCEKFDMNKGGWTNISKMSYAKSYTTPMVYGSNYIFLIGGFCSIKFDGVNIF
jgi:hypothetical protein